MGEAFTIDFWVQSAGVDSAAAVVDPFEGLFLELIHDLPILFKTGSHEAPEFDEFVGDFSMQIVN